MIEYLYYTKEKNKMFKQNVKDMTPQGQKEYYRKNASGFSIGIALLTLIAAPLMPLIAGGKYADYLVSIIISCVLGLAFLCIGILFLKKDSSVVATIMLVFFGLYIVEKIYEIATTLNPILGVWVALACLQIFYIFKYQRIKKKELADYLAKPENPTPTLPQ
jgi:hypothetical protein